MEPAFPQEVFAGRRQRLIERMGKGTIAIVPAAREQVRSHDSTFPFRQDSDFYYLTGFPEPDAVAVLGGTEPDRYLLFTRPRDPKQEIWTGRRYGPEGAREVFGADDAWSLKELDRLMPGLLADVDRVCFTFGREEALDRRVIGWISRVRERSGRGAVGAPSEIVDLSSLLHEERLVKEPAEIEAIRRACRITVEAHLAAMEACRPGMSERDLQVLLEHRCLSLGSRAMAYETIVASGSNACILHYVENSGTLQEGALVLVDAGCEWELYASDVTRTFPVSGRFTSPQRRLYEMVLEAQEAAIRQARRGETIRSVHETVVRHLAEGLARLGILAGDPEAHARRVLRRPRGGAEADQPPSREPGEEVGLDWFYMHNTSHWLGMDVHDPGRYRRGKRWRVLEAGMVLTVEPGVYIPAEAEYAPPEYRGIGIRIEDDVLITPTGNEILTRDCPKSIEEVEAACRGEFRRRG